MSASPSLHAIAVAFVLFASPAGAEDDVRRLSSEPRRGQAVGGAHALARMDFRFGDIEAWLLEDGAWHIEGMVQHRGALCADYRLGLRFGRGSPGCANVEWLTEDNYGTFEVQCNNALVRHFGGGEDPVAARNFGRITCGQRLIRCDGNCK
ncbi:MAG: hypothetical protein ACREU7_05945 [Burkholderiales bacterium]